MLQGSNPRNANSRIAEELHFNPGANPQFLKSVTGYSDTTISQTLKRMEFEHFAIPIHLIFSQNQNSAYVLSKLGGSKYIGRYRDPLTVSEAIAAGHYRLHVARAVARYFFHTRKAEWIISPWRPKRSTRSATALMCFRDSKTSGHLKLIYFVSLLETAESVRAAIQSWMEAILKDPLLSTLPLEIMIISNLAEHPELVPYFRTVFEHANRVVSILGFHEINEQNIAGRILCNQPDHWGRVATVGTLPLALMPRSNFDNESRLTPYPHSTTLRDHLRRSRKPEAKIYQQFLEARRPDLYLLELVARFPGLKSHEYRELVRYEIDGEKFDREFGVRLKRVWDAGWLRIVSHAGDRYALSDTGLEVLAATEGLPVRDLKPCLGKTTQASFFVNQSAHLAATVAVVKLLGIHTRPESWKYLCTRLTCEGIELVRTRESIKKMVIEPDSILIPPINNTIMWLYLEVDRGTRNGKDLEGQLKKYMRLPLARIRPCLPGPVLYVIDAGDQSLTRRDLIGTKIQQLFKEQFYSPLTHFFTVTRSELEQNTADPWSTRVTVHHKDNRDKPQEELMLREALGRWYRVQFRKQE